MKSLLRGLCLGLWTTLLVSLTACGGGGGGFGGTGTQPEGTLRLAIADAPACGYDAVNISVQKVRVHQDANAGDDDAGWSEIVLAPFRGLINDGTQERTSATHQTRSENRSCASIRRVSGSTSRW